ncbi:hypothetical protein TUE45_pSRTUE45c_0582 (plasmid) [Streptomyces reticuli]|nr:hypothetical protein TUE45_pSRTUE45c_0582 [Streptomyces reticuli]
MPRAVLWETEDGLPRLSGVVDWDGEELLGRVLALSGGALGGDVPGRISTIRGTFALQQALCAQRDGDEEELADGLTGYR